MAIVVRPARPGDGTAILVVHRRAIHEIACADYPNEVLAAWGPQLPEVALPQQGAIFDRKIELGEIVLVADVDGVIAGFGEIAPASCLLVAVYVNPDFKRQGVGKALLRELERIAQEQSVPYLQMDSSLTAAPFYATHGYRNLGQGFHRLRNGGMMKCVKMRKDLA